MTQHLTRAFLSFLVVALALALPGLAQAGTPKTSGPEDRVIFYLHGKIVEDQGPDAQSDRFGRYEYEAILTALGRNGHRVISEVRKPKTDPREYAKQIASDIEELKSTGLRSDYITVVGASKGAGIAVLVSHLLQDANINYVFLAICSPQLLEFWEKQDICIAGDVLSIYETSDELAGSCATFVDRCSAGVVRFEEIELNLGIGHGMLYRPFGEWVTPALAWSVNEDAARQPAEPSGR